MLTFTDSEPSVRVRETVVPHPGECYTRACSLSHAQLCVTLWTIVRQAPLSVGFLRQESWSGLPFPTPGDLPSPGIKPTSPEPPALAGGFFTTEPPGKPIFYNCCCCSVAQSCPTLCNPMDCSTPGLSVPHLPKFAQVHVHCISDAIQPSYPLTPSSDSALNLSQHQGLFQ